MTAATTDLALARRVDELEWDTVVGGLDEIGIAPLGPILCADECNDLGSLYDEARLFRSTVDMARHRFGRGQYRYFAHPLPRVVAELREAFWPHLLPVARAWSARLDRPARWPDDLHDWLAQCQAAGQTRPTPLMLRYRAGDWNALHQDLYGDVFFRSRCSRSFRAKARTTKAGSSSCSSSVPARRAGRTCSSPPRERS